MKYVYSYTNKTEHNNFYFIILQDIDSGPDINESLTKVEEGRFRIYNVEEDSSLRPFVEDVCHLHYEPRRFFFEFFNEEEDISKDKEIILMDKVREQA